MAKLIYKTVGSTNACIQGVSISQIIYTGPTQIMFLGKLREKLTKKISWQMIWNLEQVIMPCLPQAAT